MGVSFELDADVGNDFPEARICFVVALGLRNDRAWHDAEEALLQLERQVAQDQWRPYDKTHPAIRSWHDAYRRFGTNPNRNRPSVDALSRRLARNGQLPRINPAVNTYNMVSVRFGTPVGAFDLDRLNGSVLIRYGKEGDIFVPLGEPGVAEAPRAGEVVYACGNLVLTRHWNYRDADSTKVADDSKNVVFVIERISSSAIPNEVIKDAQDMLMSLLRPHADTVIGTAIEPEAPSTDLQADRKPSC